MYFTSNSVSQINHAMKKEQLCWWGKSNDHTAIQALAANRLRHKNLQMLLSSNSRDFAL
jgi:hypothetical protein